MGAQGARLNHRLALAAVSMVLTVGITGCSDDDDSGLPPPRSPEPTTTSPEAPAIELTAEEQEAVDGARAAFEEGIEGYIELATSGEPPGEEALFPVMRLLTHVLDSDIQAELVNNYLEDRRLDGELEWEFVEVVEVDLDHVARSDGTPAPQVRLRYCLDATDWVTVDKETGERVSEPGVRSMAIVTGTYEDPSRSGNERWGTHVEREEDDPPC